MTNDPKSSAMDFSEDRIREFAAGWYRALDFHLPFADVFSFLTDSDLRMDFPDGKIVDRESFRTWYDRVTNIFFDENHYLNSLEAKPDGDRVTVNIVVGWQASLWQPPEAKSRRVCLDAVQRWSVGRSTKNRHGLEIVSYEATVEPFRYAPGFARL
jgi:hypothetical protein